MYCVGCSKVIPDSAKFCPFCGTKVPVPGKAEEFQPERTSRLAVASLVLGILALPTVGVTGLVGVALGIVALLQIERSRGKLGGKEMAIAGTALSAFFVMTLPIMAAVMFPVFARAREKARMSSCQANLRQLALGAMMYAEDYDNRLPLKENWQDSLYPYVRNREVFRCPSAGPDQDSYAFNASLSGMSLEEIENAPEVVLFFDAPVGRNQSGGVELLANRHVDGADIAFVDGRVKWVGKTSVVQWDPRGSPAAEGSR